MAENRCLYGNEPFKVWKVLPLDKIKCKIEFLRELIVKEVSAKGFSHPDVMTLSRQINEEINKYYKMREESRPK